MLDVGQQRPCGRCDADHYIERAPEAVGYRRDAGADTSESVAYISPGGVKCMIPRHQKKFVVVQLCNCERRRRGLPLLDG